MAKYCDPKLLESVWAHWLYASATPDLEPLRVTRKLWKKQLTPGRVVHAISSDPPIYFDTLSEVNLETPINYSDKVAEQLRLDNYVPDVPVTTSWDQLVSTIYSICLGLSLKFNPRTDEERSDLAHEALEATLKKISRGKLTFTAGRASVFNLLTTAIIRIMYSIKNKESRRRHNQSKFADEIIKGGRLPHLRSLMVSRSSVSVDQSIKTR